MKFQSDQIRSFSVSGKRNIKVRQVEFSSSSMNNSDAFILDGGKEQTIYVYQPKGASRMERFKAIAGELHMSHLVIKNNYLYFNMSLK